MSARDELRDRYIDALSGAHETHPCPTTGSKLWTGCVHFDADGRVSGVGSCHSERRADAVLAARDEELDRLRGALREACDHVAEQDDKIERLTRDRDGLIAAGREALTSLDELIADHPDPGTAVHGSRHMLAQALLVDTQEADLSRAAELRRMADELASHLSPANDRDPSDYERAMGDCINDLRRRANEIGGA